MTVTNCLGADLPIKVYFNTGIDGNKIIKLCYNTDIIRVLYRIRKYAGIIIYIIVELWAPQSKRHHLPVTVNVFPCTGDLPRFRHFHEGINIHLRMDAEVVNVRIAYHVTD